MQDTLVHELELVLPKFLNALLLIPLEFAVFDQITLGEIPGTALNTHGLQLLQTSPRQYETVDQVTERPLVTANLQTNILCHVLITAEEAARTLFKQEAGGTEKG